MSVSLKKKVVLGKEAAVIDNNSTSVSTEGTKAMKTAPKVAATVAPETTVASETAPVAAKVVDKATQELTEKFHKAHQAFVDTLFNTYKHCTNPELAAEIKEEVISHFEEMKFAAEKLGKFDIIVRKATRNLKNLDRGSEMSKAMKAAAAATATKVTKKAKKALATAANAADDMMDAASKTFGEAPLTANS